MTNRFLGIMCIILLSIGGANVVNETVDFEKNSSRSEAIIDLRVGPNYSRVIPTVGRKQAKRFVCEWNKLLRKLGLNGVSQRREPRRWVSILIVAIFVILTVETPDSKMWAFLPMFVPLMAIASRQPHGDSDERRRIVEKMFENNFGVTISVDDKSDKEIEKIYEAFCQRVIDEGDDLDDEERAQLGREVRDESLRRHGLAISGMSALMNERISFINLAIDKLGIRDSLLASAGCPVPAEQPKRLDEAIRLLAKVTVLNTEGELIWDEIYDAALAIGDMQMGKTATFLLLAILTLEMSSLILPKLDLVVIVSGRPKEPRTQTIDAARVLSQWDGHTEFEVVSGRYSDLSKGTISSHLTGIERCWREGRTPVLIVKKDSNVLKCLIQLLDLPLMQGKKGLLLQDEADEASVVQKEGRTLVEYDEGVHGKVSDIRDRLSGPYVGFTATENAIMMMPTGSSLFAKRIVMLTPGAAYKGPDFWLLQTPAAMNRDVGDIQQPVTAQDALDWRTQSPDSIGQFVMDHVIATATKRLINGEEVISKALMNISMRKDVHDAVSQSVVRILRRISRALEHYAATDEWLDADVARWWRESGKLQRTRLKHFGIECNFWRERDQLDRLVASGLAISRGTKPYVLNEATDSDWDESMNDVIIIAGAKAGRAVVFKGLTGIFMPLDPAVNAEDTNLQRLRQCGYRCPTLDLPFMWQAMLPAYRNDMRKMVQTRMLQRTLLREYDMANVDMRVNLVDRILPSRCALTGASRSGLAVSGNHGGTATTRPIRDRVKVTRDGTNVTMISNHDDDDLVELLALLGEHSERVQLAQLERGLVFINVDPRMLAEIAKFCADPDAIAYLGLQMDLHIENSKRLNVCFRVRKPVEGRIPFAVDKFSDEVVALLRRLGWPFETAFCNRRAVNVDEEGNAVVDDDGCIKVKQLVGSYLGYGPDADLGHDLALDDMASGGRTGGRLEGDPSLFTFGIFRLTLDGASSHAARVVAGNPPLLICGVVPDELAIAQRSVVNDDVVENERAARSMNGGEDDEDDTGGE